MSSTGWYKLCSKTAGDSCIILFCRRIDLYCTVLNYFVLFCRLSVLCGTVVHCSVGYKLVILTNSSLVGNLSLEADTTSLMLNNLTSGSIYSLRIAAVNRSQSIVLDVIPNLVDRQTVKVK